MFDWPPDQKKRVMRCGPTTTMVQKKQWPRQLMDVVGGSTQRSHTGELTSLIQRYVFGYFALRVFFFFFSQEQHSGTPITKASCSKSPKVVLGFAARAYPLQICSHAASKILFPKLGTPLMAGPPFFPRVAKLLANSLESWIHLV